MQFNITLIGIVIAIIVIWVLVEIKRKDVAFRHRAFAIFLILLLLFLYFSTVIVFKGTSPNFSSISGIKDAGIMYYAWLSSIFGNLKSLTTNAIKMNWGINNATGNITITNFTNLSN